MAVLTLIIYFPKNHLLLLLSSSPLLLSLHLGCAEKDNYTSHTLLDRSLDSKKPVINSLTKISRLQKELFDWCLMLLRLRIKFKRLFTLAILIQAAFLDYGFKTRWVYWFNEKKIHALWIISVSRKILKLDFHRELLQNIENWKITSPIKSSNSSITIVT